MPQQLLCKFRKKSLDHNDRTRQDGLIDQPREKLPDKQNNQNCKKQIATLHG
jgi:hypothetical protein